MHLRVISVKRGNSKYNYGQSLEYFIPYPGKIVENTLIFTERK
ncbi:MAG: hypothetical protein ACYCR9_08550 [Cuniculiplasma sp.]